MIRAPRKRMTIRQLKAHLDRRLNHIERTKADKADLRRLVTKRYARRFATKEDLKRFATKDDLKQFATKEDLERYATRHELARQFESVNARLDAVINSIREEIRTHSLVLDEHEARLRDLELTSAR